MAVIESDRIAAALKKKGFRKHENDHHFWFFYYRNQKTSVFTKLSHGSGYKEYGDKLIKEVYTQMHLNKRQLFSFVDCTITENQYIKIIRAQGCLPGD